MGATNWSDDHYAERAAFRAATNAPVFAYDAAMKTAPVSARKVNDKMNPHGVKFRESRDSSEHPDSRAVAVFFDVTGSMDQVPKILQANLPKLMGLLIRKGYIEHPQIMIGAVGDATCDIAPLQIGQFESGIEIEEDLQKIFLEGGGGGQKTESYEMAMYWLARHTSIDCFEKRQQKGYLFIIGDELPYGEIDKRLVEKLIGDKIEANIPIRDIISELQEKWEVFYIIPNMTSYYNDPEILNGWRKLLVQNVLRLEDPAGICELIASTVGLAENAVDIDGVSRDLADYGASDSVSRAVTSALVPVASSTSRGLSASVPDSGAATGISVV